MASSRQTINKPSIKPRRMSFKFEDITNRYWFDNNSLLTTFFAAMSATFPPGEQQFISSVRYYRNKIDDENLKKQIRGFIGQEGHHGQQHKKANQKMTELGLPVTEIEKHFERHISKVYRMISPGQRLALTVASEHLTAVMAEHVLSTPEMTAPMHPAIAELVSWHAIEEIEHKAVAFDVYMQCVGSRKLLRRTLTILTLNFAVLIVRYQVSMLYANKTIPSFRELTQFVIFFLGPKGILSNCLKPYLDFYRKDFHPWDHNNTDLVENWKKQHKSQKAAEDAVNKLMV